MRDVSNSEDILDSRDVIKRYEELQSDRQSLVDAVEEFAIPEDGVDMDETGREAAEKELSDWDTDNGDELKALAEFVSEGEQNISDWPHGETLVRESYFTTYAQELAEDIGAVKSDLGWPYDHIDWEAAAADLKQDYTTLDFDGVTYYARS